VAGDDHESSGPRATALLDDLLRATGLPPSRRQRERRVNDTQRDNRETLTLARRTWDCAQSLLIQCVSPHWLSRGRKDSVFTDV
jgi:hypothetical protein